LVTYKSIWNGQIPINYTLGPNLTLVADSLGWNLPQYYVPLLEFYDFNGDGILGSNNTTLRPPRFVLFGWPASEYAARSAQGVRAFYFDQSLNEMVALNISNYILSDQDGFNTSERAYYPIYVKDMDNEPGDEIIANVVGCGFTVWKLRQVYPVNPQSTLSSAWKWPISSKRKRLIVF